MHVKIRKRIGNPTLYNAKINYSLDYLAVRTGLEPATPCVTGMYSNQLNYRTISLFCCYLSRLRLQR